MPQLSPINSLTLFNWVILIILVLSIIIFFCPLSFSNSILMKKVKPFCSKTISSLKDHFKKVSPWKW
uniref:ATP synthase F0 subunit 8 n=1 Tax=Rhynchocinetes durbanensis TaxID=516932 RepID=A0A0X9RPB3_9EUCA|nr:ATP synthase F0 subunit 8 [Rhynchocinetes durbanensis]AMA20519.1 ATP synthase F0 subunit 8 [Rhynchocinetes durbanensis]